MGPKELDMTELLSLSLSYIPRLPHKLPPSSISWVTENMRGKFSEIYGGLSVPANFNSLILGYI